MLSPFAIVPKAASKLHCHLLVIQVPTYERSATGTTDSSFQIDCEKLATLAGYTNVQSANNAWRAIMKKLASGTGTNAASDDAAAATGNNPCNLTVRTYTDTDIA